MKGFFCVCKLILKLYLRNEILTESWKILVFMISGRSVLTVFQMYLVWQFWCLSREDTSPAYQESAIYLAYLDILNVILTQQPFQCWETKKKMGVFAINSQLIGILKVIQLNNDRDKFIKIMLIFNCHESIFIRQTYPTLILHLSMNISSYTQLITQSSFRLV